MHKTDIHTKSDRICETIGKGIAYLIVTVVCIGILSAAIWGIHQIFRCIENILFAVVFFAAVALGG